jgi:hypothetical protein
VRRVLLVSVAAAVVSALTIRAQTGLHTTAYAVGFTAPVLFLEDPEDPSVQFVVEQGGRIRVVRNGIVQTQDFLDLRSEVLFNGERGLLGLVFAPGDPTRFFVNFVNRAGDTVIARFRRSSNPLVASPASRFDLRWSGGGTSIPQPFPNHKGGNLVFGPDGFLYIGLGDGGSADDPADRAQNPSELLGKMLRIDVNVSDSHPTGYQIPPSNPFVTGGGLNARPEIWSFGLRNPWRYSFDDPARGGTGALIIGDVGQDRFEEIDYEPAGRGGRNYGWRNREGAHDNVTSRSPAYLPLTDPIFEYGRDVGQTVAGGYVYRGRFLDRAHVGRYFFADYVAGRVWSIALVVDAQTGDARAFGLVEHTNELGGSSVLGNISSFGLDADGEMYLVSYSRGIVLRIAGGLTPPAVPSGLRIVR